MSARAGKADIYLVPGNSRYRTLVSSLEKSRASERLPLFPVTLCQSRKSIMRKVVKLAAFLFATVAGSAAAALPGTPVYSQSLKSAADVIEIKGGHGRGHGWGRGHHHRAYGWSRGRKVGWGGHRCPPGHSKKGWC